MEEVYCDNSIDTFIENVSNFLSTLSNISSVDQKLLKELKNTTFSILKRIGDVKNDPQLNDKLEPLILLHTNITKEISSLCQINVDEDIRNEAFKALLDLLPHQIVLKKKMYFPNNSFAEVLKIIISSKCNISFYLNHIQELLIYPDISRNVWKALEISCSDINKLSPEEVKNVLEIVNCTGKHKLDESIGPQLYYCRVSEGVLSDKDIGSCIKKIWDKLAAVSLPDKLVQNLLLTLLEKLMPRMIRPIFLTDFFMTTLEYGGSISILALQGIFNLYKDENMNYPDVYKKLYSMVTPDLFEAQYKARFYYLTDIFLSSSHLPENLVASFAKRFARLSLVAPPPDVIILLAFIENLIIRHRGLKKLVSNSAKTSYENDPFLEDEEDPSNTGAGQSVLWEVELLGSHVLPAVSVAASFIHTPSTVEKDLSQLLENTTEEMFAKEHKKKMKNPPISFERPMSHAVPKSDNVFNLWQLGY